MTKLEAIKVICDTPDIGPRLKIEVIKQIIEEKTDTNLKAMVRDVLATFQDGIFEIKL